MFKKILFVMLVSLLFAAPAFATISDDEGQTITDTSSGDLISKLSANVYADVETSVASYAIATKATKGTKIYGTSSQDTSIFVKDGTADTPLTSDDGIAGTSDSSAFATGWTEM